MKRVRLDRPSKWLRLLAVLSLCTFGWSSAKASDYGCKVLLCLANPAGPTAVSQCVPPITQLWNDLTRFHPFPSCDEASASGARALIGSSYFDPCPDSTTALAAGQYGVLPTLTDPYAGIGNGDNLQPDENNMLPAKVCVGNQINTASVWIGPEDTGGYQPIAVYDRLVVLDASANPRTIDVYVNDLLYRRVRW